jgi:hypothetical protein
MIWLYFRSPKRLIVNGVRRAKNIFKKVAKIPPGELQTRSVVIKWRDETRVSKCGVSEFGSAFVHYGATGCGMWNLPRAPRNPKAQIPPWRDAAQNRVVAGHSRSRATLQQAASLRYNGVRLGPTKSKRVKAVRPLNPTGSKWIKVDHISWIRSNGLVRSRSVGLTAFACGPGEPSEWPTAKWQMAKGDAAWGYAANRRAGGFGSVWADQTRSKWSDRAVRPGRLESNRVAPSPSASDHNQQARAAEKSPELNENGPM